MKRYTQQSGYYLLEVMIVVLFLAIGLLSLSKLNSIVSGYDTLIRQRANAIYLGQAEIESLRDFQCIAAISGCTNTYNAIASGNSTVTGTTATYTITWTVTNSNSPTYKMLDVTVTWTASDNSAQSVSFSTIIYPNDPALSATLMTNGT